MSRPRLCVLASAGGTTLQNLLDRTADGRLAADVVGVVSSDPAAYAVTRAGRAGVPVAVVERGARSAERGTPDRAAPVPGSALRAPGSFSDRVFDAVRGFRPDWVVLAGWLHLLVVPADFRHRVLNIHPSLLPAFGGKGMYGHHVHEAVLAHGCRVSGCTVHLVDDSYDTGPILVQRAVPVLDADTPESLAGRVYAAECEAYPEAIARVAAGGWRVAGRRVVWG